MRDIFALIGVVCAYCVLAAIAWCAALECSARSARRYQAKREPEVENTGHAIVHPLPPTPSPTLDFAPPVLQYPPIEQCTHPLHHRTLHVDAESDAQALDAITRRVR